MRVRLARRLSDPWLAAVDLVRQKYAETFHADVMPDPDYFIIADNGTEPDNPTLEIAACAGLTVAPGPLFSEQYLPAPIETMIERQLGVTLDRQHIVEIGSLAGRARLAGREVIRLTPIIAWCMGMRYILCTATASLMGDLDRFGIQFIPLAPAVIDRLPAGERDRWGSYYDQNPQVGVIPLAELSQLFTESTGRYSFLDLDVMLRMESETHQGVTAHAER